VPIRLDPGTTPAGLVWEDVERAYDPATGEAGDVIQSRVEHNLGFFPGVWIQNLPVPEEEDGEPDCAGGWQIVDTMDRLLAQMNKGILQNLDPTVVIKRDLKRDDDPGVIMKGSSQSIAVDLQGDAKYMEISGEGVRVGAEVFRLLKDNFCAVVRFVDIDPEKISGRAQSAKAIEIIFARMLEKADDLRAQYGELGVLPILRVIERISRAVDGKRVFTADGSPVTLKVLLPPRVEVEALPDDAPAEVKPKRHAVERKLGPGGHIRLEWGPYFAPTEQDRQVAIQNAVAARAGRLIDKRTAVKAAAGMFEVRDAESMYRQVRREEQEDLAHATAGLGGDLPYTAPPVSGETPEGEPEPPAGQGGRP